MFNSRKSAAPDDQELFHSDKTDEVCLLCSRR